jgi:LPXTG-site transpeptidase (sortase) family protein
LIYNKNLDENIQADFSINMPTRSHIYQNPKSNKSKFLIPILLLIASLIFAGFVWFSRSQNTTKEIKNIVQSSKSQPQKKSTDSKTVQDPNGEKITDKVKEFGIDMGFISSENIKELQQTLPIKDETVSDLSNYPQRPTLQGIIPSPAKADQKNLLVWEKLNIKAPVQNASFQDLFQSNSDGTVDFGKSIDNNPTFSPVQQLLQKGVVHLPFSPRPGEVGNSYIIGHSSNYITVLSDYNEVFKPLEQAKKDDEFIIFDHKGRSLPFKVFEILEVKEEDVAEAYKNMGDKRVVTLQGSILETVNGKLLPTKRRLVRAELMTQQ